MATFLDLGGSRIQTWLTRTPMLRMRRGGSALLSEMTAHAAVRSVADALSDRTSARWEPNLQAGIADGVVNLTSTDELREELVRAAAREALSLLRRHLPALDLQAAWGWGPTYVEAHRDHISPMLSSGPLVAFAPPAEAPLATVCTSCGLDPISRVDPSSGKRAYCRDCAARLAADVRHRAPEQGRAAQIQTRDLGQLALVGKPDGHGNNHLAHIAIDGNGFGRFFDRVADGADPDLKRSISPKVKQATVEALQAAVDAVTRPGDAVSPVTAHLVGGDDVLVSVAAARAWPFTLTFLQDFGKRCAAVEREARAVLEAAGDAGLRLSASAGVVFSHAAHPMSQNVVLAEGALRRAKRDVQGLEASVHWQDVTREGSAGDPRRRTWRLAELDDPRLAMGLSLAAGAGQSGRYALLRGLDASPPELARETLVREVRRTADSRPYLVPLLDWALGPASGRNAGSTGEASAEELLAAFRSSGTADGTVARVREALLLASWWTA